MNFDPAQCLVARAGEIITCPECGEELVIFGSDRFGPGLTIFPSESLPAIMVRSFSDRTGQLFCLCGASPVSRGRGELLEAERAPRIHLSTGWRDLGGE